jgi:monoterpene epsilon-lactone hydrolase
MPLVPTEPPSRDSWFTFHSLSAQDRALLVTLRAAAAPNKGRMRGVAARAPFDAIMSGIEPPAGVSFREGQAGGIAGWWCEPLNAVPDAAILHLHGGWFSLGSASAYRHLVGHIARSAGAVAFVPEYRLAPEHPFPAAVEDARASLRGMAEYGTRNLAVTGDSAGGNLALGLLSSLVTDRSITVRPTGVVLLSPVTDLALTGSSWQTRAAADPYFVRDQIEDLIQSYLNGHDPRDPLASPLHGNLAGLPPLRVQVGDDEVLLEDSQRLVTRAVTAGVDARLDVWEGMPHGFLGLIGRAQAATSALSSLGRFLSSRREAVSSG